MARWLRDIQGAGSEAAVFDVGDQDWTWTSTRINLAPKDFPDANPNAAVYSRGHRYVIDAGANILVKVKRNGAVKVLAFFRVPAGAQSDAVPTCVARGPDGALYVGEWLGGFCSPGHALNEGPTANPAGDVLRIDRHGHRAHLGVGRLFFPSGFAAQSNGAIYVSNCSIAPAAGMGPDLCPTGGQVVRVR